MTRMVTILGLVGALTLAGCTGTSTEDTVRGGGESQRLARWTSASEIEPSSITDDGENVSLLDGTALFTTTFDGKSSHARVVLPSNVADRGPFSLDTGINVFNETADPSLAIGYNTNHHGRKLLNDEHSLGWYIEADYNDGHDRLMEIYTQYNSEDLLTQIRPLFFQFNRTTRRLSNSVILGNPLNVMDDLGNSSLELSPTVALFKSGYLASTSANWNIYTTAPNGNVFVKSNGGTVFLNPNAGNGNVDIASGGGVTSIGGPAFFGNTVQVHADVRVTDSTAYLTLNSTAGINYIQSSTSTQGGAPAELRFTNFAAVDTWAKFDTSGNFVSYKRMKLGDNGPAWSTGVGSPESVVVAPVGSLYTRSDGGPGTTLYVKESGTGSAGWAAK